MIKRLLLALLALPLTWTAAPKLVLAAGADESSDKVRITVNDFDSLTEQIFPMLLVKEGQDNHINIFDFLYEKNQSADISKIISEEICDPTGLLCATYRCTMNATITVEDVHGSMGPNENSLHMTFGGKPNKLTGNINLDLPFWAESDIKVRLKFPNCPVPNGFIRVRGRVSSLSTTKGSINLSLEQSRLKASDAKLQLDAMRVDAHVVDMSTAYKVIDWMLSTFSFLPGRSIDGMLEKQLIAALGEKNKTKPMALLGNSIGADFLVNIPAFERRFEAAGSSIKATAKAVALRALSKKRIESAWAVKTEGSGPAGTCGGSLQLKTVEGEDRAAAAAGDLQLQIPRNLLNKAAYQFMRQQNLCNRTTPLVCSKPDEGLQSLVAEFKLDGKIGSKAIRNDPTAIVLSLPLRVDISPASNRSLVYPVKGEATVGAHLISAENGALQAELDPLLVSFSRDLDGMNSAADELCGHHLDSLFSALIALVQAKVSALDPFTILQPLKFVNNNISVGVLADEVVAGASSISIPFAVACDGPDCFAEVKETAICRDGQNYNEQKKLCWVTQDLLPNNCSNGTLYTDFYRNYRNEEGNYTDVCQENFLPLEKGPACTPYPQSEKAELQVQEGPDQCINYYFPKYSYEPVMPEGGEPAE